ncbi:MAG: DUF134 domain-containing protein [Deltaproteobacteria bacterium]|nr:DUF134 domain-containing protein [Deltaproteobacteria bacterium]
MDRRHPRRVPLRAVRADHPRHRRRIRESHAFRLEAILKMGISRQTFGRIIESARHKVAEALVRAKALKIEGGAFEIACMKRNSSAASDRAGGGPPFPTGMKRSG